jgi:L-lactate permease
VMGKMISLHSIAVAVAATGLAAADEGKLFRRMLKHSVVLACVIGVIAMGYAYIFPHWIPVAPPTP